MRAILNADREVARGNLWRAKEILQSSIPNAGYDCDLFERLGSVHLAMGDLPASGRYLFLSGRRKAAYEEPIGIFLRKHGKDWRSLFQAFPRVARLSSLSEYPDHVRKQLVDFGFPLVLKNDASSNSPIPESVMSDIVGWLMIGSVFVVMLLGIFKLVEIVRWIF